MSRGPTKTRALPVIGIRALAYNASCRAVRIARCECWTLDTGKSRRGCACQETYRGTWPRMLLPQTHRAQLQIFSLTRLRSTRSSTPLSMNQPQHFAPAATAGGQQNGPVSSKSPEAWEAGALSTSDIDTLINETSDDLQVADHTLYSPSAKTAAPRPRLSGGATNPAPSSAMPAGSSSSSTGALGLSRSRPT